MKLILLVLFCSATAHADDDLSSQIDAAAAQSATAAPSQPAAARPFQSMNPDISVIVDADAGYAKAPSYSLAGDDPRLADDRGGHPAGFTVQEAEVAFQSVIDPYFRGDVFLTIPNLEGIEVEEAFVTTTSLPANLQVKGGVFRSAFGRQNGQHLHLQDFTRRPLVNEAFLGADGLRAPGVQVSWLLPAPFFLQLIGEALSVGPPDTMEHLATFGGGRRTDLTYTAQLKAFVPASESLSLYGGLSFAAGRTAGVASDFGIHDADSRTRLEAVDLYVKYKPPNVTEGYFSLAWTTEYFVRQAGEVEVAESGFYTQLVAQVARRWFIGARQDIIDVEGARVARTSASLTFAGSEFARVRLYGERENGPPFHDFAFTGAPNWSALLQLEVAMGAHGAHPF